MNKKICQIGFLKMGIGHYISHLNQELSKDFKIMVVSYTHGSLGDKLIVDDKIIKKNIKDYKLLINPHGIKKSFDSVEKIFNLFKIKKFDILNLHVSAYTRSTSYLFIPIIEHFKRKGLKILFTIHDVLPFPEGKKLSAYLTYFYNLADAAIVGNKQEKNNLIKYFNYKNKIYIATHGVYNLFNGNIITKKNAIRKIRLKEAQNKILFFGILRENKGLEDLIRALSIVVQKNKNFILVIASLLGSGVSFNKYQNLINKYNLENNIKIFLKDSTVDEIEIYFKSTDLVVLPYTMASQSGVLNLTLAFKKPIILTNCFAESKTISKNMGFLVPAKSPEKLALAIQEFFNNKENYNKLFQKNITNYNLSHSFEQTAVVYKRAINSLLKNKR